MELPLLQKINERAAHDMPHYIQRDVHANELRVSSEQHGGKTQTEQLILKSIKKSPLALEFVDDKFLNDTTFISKVYKIALKKNGLALKWVKPQTEEWVKLALKTSPGAKMFVDDKFKHLIP